MLNASTPMNALVLGLFFLQPVFFNPRGDDVFHLAKNCYFLVFLLALFLVWFVRRSEEGLPLTFKKSAFPLPVLFYAASTLFSYAFSIHKATSRMDMLLTLGFYLWFVFFLHFVDKEKAFRRVLYALSLSVFLSALYGVSQRMGIDFVHWSDSSVRHRPSSAQGNPDFFGAFLAVSFPFVFYFLLKLQTGFEKPWRTKPGTFLFLSAALLLAFLSLLFTFARASWLAWIFAMIVFFLFCPRAVVQKSWKLLLAGFLLFGLMAFLVNKPSAGAGGNAAGAISERLKQKESARVRLVLWNDALHLVRDAPLWGYGPSTFPLVYPRHRSVDILRIQAVTALPEDAHNEFLQKAVTSGFLGFFSYLWLLAFIFLSILRLKKRDPFFAAMLLSAFTAYTIQSFFNPRVPDLTLLFWLMTGLSTGCSLAPVPGSERVFSVSFPFKFSSRLLRFIAGFSVCMIFALLSIPWIVKPFLADMYYHKGELVLHGGNFENAAFYFYFGMDLSPDCTKCRREFALCHKRVGELTGKQKILKEAVAEYGILLKDMPYDASLYADRGRAHLALASLDKRFYKNAEEDLKKAVSIDPKYPIFYNDLGIAYLNQSKYNQAEKKFMEAKELVPEFFDAYQNLGVLYYKKGELAKAISETRKAASLDAAAAEPHANLALFLKETGHLKEAEKEIQTALKLFPGSKRYLSLQKMISGAKSVLTPGRKADDAKL